MNWTEMTRGTMIDALGIELVTITDNKVVLRMPVTATTHQPAGFLHGGASVALAETAASVGSLQHALRQGKMAFGLEINANHVRPKRDGVVTATAVAVHLGRTTHIWDIRIEDEEGKLVCISRCTVAIVDPAR